MRELRRFCAELLRRSVLTLAALPDRDRRHLDAAWRSSLPEPVREASAYGYEAARAARFKPSPKDISRFLEVLAWLTWLEGQHDGRRDVKIIVARAFGCPWWKLAQRFGRSDETLRRWQAGAVAAIAQRFWREVDRMDRG